MTTNASLADLVPEQFQRTVQSKQEDLILSLKEAQERIEHVLYGLQGSESMEQWNALWQFVDGAGASGPAQSKVAKSLAQAGDLCGFVRGVRVCQPRGDA